MTERKIAAKMTKDTATHKTTKSREEVYLDELQKTKKVFVETATNFCQNLSAVLTKAASSQQ